jgi:hypothetical protein
MALAAPGSAIRGHHRPGEESTAAKNAAAGGFPPDPAKNKQQQKPNHRQPGASVVARSVLRFASSRPVWRHVVGRVQPPS